MPAFQITRLLGAAGGTAPLAGFSQPCMVTAAPYGTAEGLDAGSEWADWLDVPLLLEGGADHAAAAARAAPVSLGRATLPTGATIGQTAAVLPQPAGATDAAAVACLHVSRKRGREAAARPSAKLERPLCWSARAAAGSAASGGSGVFTAALTEGYGDDGASSGLSGPATPDASDA